MNTQLTTIKNEQQLIIEAKQLVRYKPTLVKAVESNKIREYSEVERESKNSIIITYLLSLLGISETNGIDRTTHYIAVDDYISSELQSYSYQEIKEAFKMYVKGVFKEDFDKVIYKLDCVILSKVMNCYDSKKADILRNYDSEVAKNKRLLLEKQNQLSESEKEKIIYSGLENAFKEYKEHQILSSGRIYLYDFLYQKNVLPKDKGTKDVVLKIAKQNIKKQQKNAISRFEKAKLNVLNAKGENSQVVINECYKLTLKQYFSKFVSYDQLLNDINKKQNETIKK